MSPKEIVKELKLMPQIGRDHWSSGEGARQTTREDYLNITGSDPKQYQVTLEYRIKTISRQIRNAETSFENIIIVTFP